MKVRELIKQLEQFDPEMDVVKSYNYGDHWNTTVCPYVEYPEELEIKYSAYHGMNMVHDSGDDVDDFTEMVVVL
jgi:hypothetical protein